jgi:hypothetical protein
LGRFVSADSIVPGAGNPQAFNRYSYVLGNPLRYTDPTGHRCENGDEDFNGECLNDIEESGDIDFGSNATEEILSYAGYEDVKETLCGTKAWLICTNLNYQLEPEYEFYLLLQGGTYRPLAGPAGILMASSINRKKTKGNNNDDNPRVPSGQPPKRREGLRENMEAAGIKQSKNMKNAQAHHNFPWNDRQWFSESPRNINVNHSNYGRWVEGSPQGQHQNWTHSYNAQWDQFISNFPNATKAAVFRFLAELLSSGNYP